MTIETRQVGFDISNISVMLSMPIYKNPPPWTIMSLLRTQRALIERRITHMIDITASPYVHHARSRACHTFLQGPFNRLFFIDHDMEWQAEDFIRMLALSTKMQALCAVYPLKTDPITLPLGTRDADKPIERNEWGCIPLEGAPIGFCVLDRIIIETLAAKAPKRHFSRGNGSMSASEAMPYIFRLDDVDLVTEGAKGEDMAFFDDVSAAGFKLWCDPSITLGHVGEKVYSAPLSDAMVPIEGDT